MLSLIFFYRYTGLLRDSDFCYNVKFVLRKAWESQIPSRGSQRSVFKAVFPLSSRLVMHMHAMMMMPTIPHGALMWALGSFT